MIKSIYHHKKDSVAKLRNNYSMISVKRVNNVFTAVHWLKTKLINQLLLLLLFLFLNWNLTLRLKLLLHELAKQITRGGLHLYRKTTLLNNTYVLAPGPIVLCSFLYISVTFPVAVCCVSIWTRGSCVCNSRGGHDSRWHSSLLNKRENGDSFSLFGWWRAVKSCNTGVHTDNTWQKFSEGTRITWKL